MAEIDSPFGPAEVDFDPNMPAWPQRPPRLRSSDVTRMESSPSEGLPPLPHSYRHEAQPYGLPEEYLTPAYRGAAEGITSTAKMPTDITTALIRAHQNIREGRMPDPEDSMMLAQLIGSVRAPLKVPGKPKIETPGFNKGMFEGKPVRDPAADWPGVWGHPDDIVAAASKAVAPEDTEAWKAVFPGWDRERLYEASQQGQRVGNVDPRENMILPKNPKGADSARAVATQANADRLVGVMKQARHDVPDMWKGMVSWYAGDPEWEYTLKAFNGDVPAALKAFHQRNIATGAMSPSSDVETEIARGSALNFLHNQGRMEDFKTYGGKGTFDPKQPDKPYMAQIGMPEVPGHAFHSTAHAPAAERALKEGRYTSTEPKVASYIPAFGTPETGQNTEWFVGDAHHMRSTGTPLFRGVKSKQDYGASMSASEAHSLWPWYREQVAGPMGVRPTAAQGFQWGVYAPQTGVDTKVAAPKAELDARYILKRARQLGWPVDVTRNMILRGEMYGLAGGVSVPLAGTMINNPHPDSPFTSEEQ